MRLLGRAWEIRNARGETVGQVPRGSPGIVGQTPVLVPGHGSFVYSSSGEIDTPTGVMQASAGEILSPSSGFDRRASRADVERVVQIMTLSLQHVC